MRCFGTQGPVNPQEHYVVSRSDELSDYIKRVEAGKYVVLFAPRQTGKTTFFKTALETLAIVTKPENTSIQTESTPKFAYFPIQLNFDIYKNLDISPFYTHFFKQIRDNIEAVFQKREIPLTEVLKQLLDETTLTDHLEMLSFFSEFMNLLNSNFDGQQVVLVIDEFDGIPTICGKRFSAYATSYLHCRQTTMSTQCRHCWCQEHCAAQL